MTTSADTLTGLGRNAGAAVLVLSSLAGGDKHGYALVKDVQEFASVHIPPGTLYQLLARLESRGLIAALEVEERRRPYRLTAQVCSRITSQHSNEFSQLGRLASNSRGGLHE